MKRINLNVYRRVYTGSGYTEWNKESLFSFKKLEEIFSDFKYEQLKIEFTVLSETFNEVVIGERIFDSQADWEVFKTEVIMSKHFLQKTFLIPNIEEIQ